MSRTQKVILFILSIGVICMCALVAGSAYQLWQKPLGPVLQLPTNTFAPFSTFPPTWTVLAGENNSPVNIGTAPAPMATASPPAPLCGGPTEMTILAIGSSHRVDSYLYGLADVIRLVRVDFVNANVMIMSLPRDLYVEIPDISDHDGITHGKLNQPYFYGNPGMGYYDGPGEGPGLMARTLAYNFGAQPDHYIAINMAIFIKIVDAVGGITVDLPQAVDARYVENPENQRNIVFPAGINYLNGNNALLLARLRPSGVFDRVKAQNQVLCGLYDKLVSSSVVGDIPGIINAFKDNVQTDLSPEEISQLSCLGTQLKGSDIVFLNWPEDLFVGTRVDDPVLERTFIWDVDFILMREYVDAFARGDWPAAEQAASSGTAGFTPKSFCD
ncbi:MAG: LCP family protein [Anaerolineales bacterium]|uniref:LCP family protein n=1 Tax=Candidatus Desulfolinea nitratireducens TaxID=2841698 RepID=A0A8J6NLW9_9CHLR|nr:LCP family protein [Candidatus Desulfolinea nitratireducens]